MHELDETRQEEARRQALPLEEVERLVNLVRESGVGEVRVRHGEVETTVKASPEAPAPQPVTVAEPVGEVVVEPPAGERDGLHAVRSPQIGRASCRERV